MKDYERMRANISKRFKNEIQQLKLEIFKLQIENTDLKVENVKLTNKIREYKDQLENISDSQKSLLGMTKAIKYLFKGGEESEEKERGITVLDCLNMIDKHRMEARIRNEVSSNDSPTNGSIFLKTYPGSRLSNVAYDDGICYAYVDLGGSRTRFTSDWWNALYKVDKEEQE